MTYYRVRINHDGDTIHNDKGRPIVELIGNELYTPAEYKRLSRFAPDWYFDIVEIPKSRTYKMFGARFEDGTGYPSN